jgi:hypothetical protein
LINEAVEILFERTGIERTGHFARTTGVWTIEQLLGSLTSKALDPLSQGRIGKVEGLENGLDAMAHETTWTA